MFQSLRQNSQLFILHKDGPTLETGLVVNVTAPIPKWPVNQPLANIQEMVVDITVRVNGQDINYQKLPATADIADFPTGNIVIATTREAMNSEIINLKQKSSDIVDSIDYHRGVVAGCEKLLNSLNPEYAERQQQQNEINQLKDQVSSMARSIEELVISLRESKKSTEYENVGN